MRRIQLYRWWLPTLLFLIPALPIAAQSFRVQCPTYTPAHPNPTTLPPGTPLAPGAIKCQQISGGDGFATMGDGTQTYLFGFGPLSGVQDIQNGLPGTEIVATFNAVGGANGAVGLVNPATGAVDVAPIMNLGVMNANMPAPTMAIEEDDEFFLTLTNVGMIMRPDLFEQHTVHFHGYPNASSFYDGVPDASVAINIGGSFTYYYLAPDAGTYFWHCHVTPPEHLQMGMVGQLYVRPRQNRVSGSLYDGLVAQQADRRTACYPHSTTTPFYDQTNPDILCSSPLPSNHGAVTGGGTYAYNDGDASTAYDVEYPIQIHGFDPNFHFVGMTFNPEGFVDMKDKYFLLNGRSYPDTIKPGPQLTQSADGASHFSQPLPTIISIPTGGKALLRISDLDVTEFQTLASLGIPMHVVGINARLLRDLAGNDLTYYTNSITVGGGESVDVILDACAARATGGSCTTPIPSGTYYLYTPNLDHLSNDAENFGGLMTEVHICTSVDPLTKVGVGCK